MPLTRQAFLETASKIAPLGLLAVSDVPEGQPFRILFNENVGLGYYDTELEGAELNRLIPNVVETSKGRIENFHQIHDRFLRNLKEEAGAGEARAMSTKEVPFIRKDGGTSKASVKVFYQGDEENRKNYTGVFFGIIAQEGTQDLEANLSSSQRIISKAIAPSLKTVQKHVKRLLLKRIAAGTLLSGIVGTVTTLTPLRQAWKTWFPPPEKPLTTEELGSLGASVGLDYSKEAVGDRLKQLRDQLHEDDPKVIAIAQLTRRKNQELRLERLQYYLDTESDKGLDTGETFVWGTFGFVPPGDSRLGQVPAGTATHYYDQRLFNTFINLDCTSMGRIGTLNPDTPGSKPLYGFACPTWEVRPDYTGLLFNGVLMAIGTSEFREKEEPLATTLFGASVQVVPFEPKRK